MKRDERQMTVKDIFIEEAMQGNKRNVKGFLSFFVEPKRKALFQIRAAKYLYDRNHRFISKLLQNNVFTTYGSDISMQAEIGRNLRLRHINGVVIGKGVKIGDNVIIYHQVTIGGKNLGDEKANNYPVIGNNVTIFTGAKIVGNISVGDNAVIGANSVVTTDIESNSTYAGIPAKRIK